MCEFLEVKIDNMDNNDLMYVKNGEIYSQHSINDDQKVTKLADMLSYDDDDDESYSTEEKRYSIPLLKKYLSICEQAKGGLKLFSFYIHDSCDYCDYCEKYSTSCPCDDRYVTKVEFYVSKHENFDITCSIVSINATIIDMYDEENGRKKEKRIIRKTYSRISLDEAEKEIFTYFYKKAYVDNYGKFKVYYNDEERAKTAAYWGKKKRDELMDILYEHNKRNSGKIKG